MTTPSILGLVDEGLGNSAYLVDLGDGRALAVDMSVDLRAVTAAAGRHGLQVAYAAETHLHADFVSGARQLAASGAEALASVRGDRQFAHRGLDDGDEVDLGGLRLRAIATPGHTAEHLSYLLLDGSAPVAVFTGGSLLVGSAARTDLVSQDQTEALARAQFQSLHRLAALPDETVVYPTHGAGSFCSAPPSAERSTTIGREKQTNPLLAAPDEDAFVAMLLGQLGTYPTYFDRLAELNRLGPRVLHGTPSMRGLSAPEVQAYLSDGAAVVDVRPVSDYAAGHIPDSLAIPLRPVFATWLGWMADPDQPLVIVRNADQDLDEVIWQAHKVGYDRLVGELLGGLPTWAGSGLEVRVTPLVDPAAVDPSSVLDVRQRSEYAGGHLPGARNLELGRIADDPIRMDAAVVMCGHGERAVSAASLLERAGQPPVSVLTGGPQDWARRTGRSIEVSR